MKYFYSFLLITIFSFSYVNAQDDLLDILDEEVEEEIDYVAYTFKSTRIINGHNVERMKKNQLDFRVNHRFGQVNAGAYELWGLDNATINFLLEYGITDWLMVGVRRGTRNKTYDGSLKATLLRQSKGKRVMPVSVSYYSDVSYKTLKRTDTIDDSAIHRLGFTQQLLIARKFSERLSLQLTPTFVHRNRVDWFERNDIIAMGLGGRFKITRRIALTAEYFWASHTFDNDKFFNSLSIGFDLETGGHVFQLFVTNSQAMVEDAFISETTGNWADAGIYFGFNISRVFAIGIGKGSHRAH